MLAPTKHVGGWPTTISDPCGASLLSRWRDMRRSASGRQLDEDMTRLRADPVAWQAYQDEIAIWDATLMDGLEDNAPYDTVDDRSVLLIAGVSGTGKTTVARAIRRDLGVAWVQADDLRLALQCSDARLPDHATTDDLNFLLRRPTEGFIATRP